MPHFHNGIHGFGHETDLIQLDQDCISAPAADSPGEPFRLGHEKIVSDKLKLLPETFRHCRPAVPVFFIQAVFQGDDRILRSKLFPVTDQFFRRKCPTGFRKQIFPPGAAFPFAGSCIQGKNETLSYFLLPGFRIRTPMK
jgi:hypothetical protein